MGELKTEDPDKMCAECEGRMKEDGSEPPYYKVSFWWGPEPRFVPEWWCEDCVEKGIDEGWVRYDDGLVEMDINGTWYRVDEAEEEYLKGELF